MTQEILQALRDWNPWLEDGFQAELMGYRRDYDLAVYLQIPEIKIIEGARRVGKSTLLYQVIHSIYEEKKNVLYINFEDETLSHHSLASILKAYNEHFPKLDALFIDEIQICQDWVPYVRKVYDIKEFKQIWVSGSNSTLIKQEYASLLTGRNITVHIFPLSLHEFLHFKSFDNNLSALSTKQQIALKKLFLEYMHFGAFPAVVNRNILKKEILLAYFDDFIYKDIVARHHTNADKVKDLAIYLATNTSKIFSYRSIASALNCHVNTIMDYVDYLKQAFLFDELYKFDYSLKKQFANEKKIYCVDTGLAAAVSFRFSEDKGRILENIVFSELKRRKQQIYFHKGNYECDFIIKEEFKITQAIQVCYELDNTETKKREINGLCDALQTYQLNEGLLLTFEEDQIETITFASKQYTILIKPVWQWLLG